MPNWDFKCPLCGTIKEHNIGSDDPFPACPDCGITMTKLFAAAPVHFKGTGWGHQ